MRVLGLETSGDAVSVALADAGGVQAELLFRHGMELSRSLQPRLEEVLRVAGLTVRDVEGVAVSIGPGSFTGLRIGVTAAKSLAWALGVPVAGVPTLQALAAEHPAPPRALVCALQSASATDVFAALFQWHAGRLEPRAEELLAPVGDLLAHLAATPLDVVLVGQFGPHRAALQEALGGRAILAPEDMLPRAGTVARLGRERLLAGQADSVHDLAPRYLRPSAAEARRTAGGTACPAP